MDGYATGGQYYQDDGLGGLGGDDGLGGLGGYAPPQQPQYGEDGLEFMQMDEPESLPEPQPNKQDELEELLDVGLFGAEASQAASQPDSTSHQPSRSQRSGDDDDDDEATDDEQVYDDFDEGGQEQQVRIAEEQQHEATPEVLDPAALEAQRQNAWYKECFDAMSEAQRNRLEAYIRSNLQKKTMKKVLQELTGTALNERIVLAISTITKMFVGELVETARQIAARQGHAGPLLPSHIRQAYNALSTDGRVPHHAKPKPLRLR